MSQSPNRLVAPRSPSQPTSNPSSCTFTIYKEQNKPVQPQTQLQPQTTPTTTATTAASSTTTTTTTTAAAAAAASIPTPSPIPYSASTYPTPPKSSFQLALPPPKLHIPKKFRLSPSLILQIQQLSARARRPLPVLEIKRPSFFFPVSLKSSDFPEKVTLTSRDCYLTQVDSYMSAFRRSGSGRRDVSGSSAGGGGDGPGPTDSDSASASDPGTGIGSGMTANMNQSPHNHHQVTAGEPQQHQKHQIVAAIQTPRKRCKHLRNASTNPSNTKHNKHKSKNNSRTTPTPSPSTPIPSSTSTSTPPTSPRTASASTHPQHGKIHLRHGRTWDAIRLPNGIYRFTVADGAGSHMMIRCERFRRNNPTTTRHRKRRQCQPSSSQVSLHSSPGPRVGSGSGVRSGSGSGFGSGFGLRSGSGAFPAVGGGDDGDGNSTGTGTGDGNGNTNNIVYGIRIISREAKGSVLIGSISRGGIDVSLDLALENVREEFWTCLVSPFLLDGGSGSWVRRLSKGDGLGHGSRDGDGDEDVDWEERLYTLIAAMGAWMGIWEGWTV